MSLSKNDFKGLGKVFSFTFKRMLLNRANIISLFITFILIIAVFPCMSLFGNKVRQSVTDEIKNLPEQIYIGNNTQFSLNDETVKTAAGRSELSTSDIEILDLPDIEGAKYPTASEYAEKNPDTSIPYICIYETDGKIISEIAAKNELLPMLAEYSEALVNLIKSNTSGLDESKLGIITSNYSVFQEKLSDASDADDFSLDTYNIQLVYSIFTMIISIYAVSYIVQSVVQEKASKLVDTLMVSVKPLALILGKIFAVMLYVFMTLVLNGAAFYLSFLISSAITGENSSPSILSVVDLSKLQINIGTIAVCIVSLLLGYLTYSLIAGLLGTSCSSMDDVQFASSGAMTVIFICYFISAFTSMVNNPTVHLIISLIPMLSVFCAPIQFMTGGIGFGILLASWVLQLAVIGFFAVLCAKTYNDLIIYSGKPMKMTEIIKMSHKSTEIREESK